MQDKAPKFQGRLAIQQRVLPGYREQFFDTLAGACEGGLSVFAGQPRREEAITASKHLALAQYYQARNLHIGRVSSPFYLCWQSGLLAWLSAWKPDALIMEANPRYISSRIGAAWMRSQGRPVLGWGLGVPSQESRLGAVGRLGAVQSRGRLRFYSQFDGMIAYSQRGAQEYQAVGFPSERVFVAPNAVVPRLSESPPARPDSFRERPSVLFVGRLQARKRIDLLLQACAALPDALQPKLVVVGDGPAAGEFQALAAKVYPQAQFPGAKHGAELEPYFAEADIFVLPGTGGLAVQQAMTYGLPVIAAEGDGTQVDLVRPGNGWQVKPGDEIGLEHALTEALSDVERLRMMGAESYRIVHDEINVEAMVAVFIQALHQIMTLGERPAQGV